MAAMSVRHRFIFSRAITASAVVATFVAAAACSGSESPDRPEADAKAFQRTTPTDRVVTIEDLRAAGLRTNKEYGVAGLPGALSAFHGFLNSKEYEARFYASHADATSTGTAEAAKVTGKDAAVIGDAVPWAEGAIDRRKCVGAINSNCTAKYPDFAVYGNLVLLCEGRDSQTSLEACEALLSRLSPR
jgi:hypothetical protein